MFIFYYTVKDYRSSMRCWWYMEPPNDSEWRYFYYGLFTCLSFCLVAFRFSVGCSTSRTLSRLLVSVTSQNSNYSTEFNYASDFISFSTLNENSLIDINLHIFMNRHTGFPAGARAPWRHVHIAGGSRKRHRLTVAVRAGDCSASGELPRAIRRIRGYVSRIRWEQPNHSRDTQIGSYSMMMMNMILTAFSFYFMF